MWTCSQRFIELNTMTQLLWSLLFMSGQQAVYIPKTLPENRTWVSLTAQRSVQTSSQLAGEDVCSVPQRGLQAGAGMDADRYQKTFLSMKSCLNIYRLIMVVGITATSKHHHVERSHTEVRHMLFVHFQSSSPGLWRDLNFIEGIFFIYWWGIWDWGSSSGSSSVKHIFPQSAGFSTDVSSYPHEFYRSLIASAEFWLWSQFDIRLLSIRRVFTIFSKSQAASQDNHLFRWC